jgi:hypothetical protein
MRTQSAAEQAAASVLAVVWVLVLYTPRGQGTKMLQMSTGQKLDVLRS